MLLLFLSNHNETCSKWAIHRLLILTKFRYDCIKNARMKTNIIKFWMNLTHSNSQKEINLYTPTFLETYRGFELGFIYVCSKVHYTWQMRLQDMSDKIMTSDGLKHSILKSVFYKSNVEDSFASKIEPHISYKQLRW